MATNYHQLYNVVKQPDLIDNGNVVDQYIPATTAVRFVVTIGYKTDRCVLGTCRLARLLQETIQLYNEHRRKLSVGCNIGDYEI